MQSTPDRDLVIRAQKGERQAFGQLVDRYHAMTLAITRRFAQTPELAEELAQEALLQAYLSLKNLQNPERFRSWLYSIAQNTCRNHLRNQKPPAHALENGNTHTLPFDHIYTITTHHLLLALARAKRGVAAQILAEHNIPYDVLKTNSTE